MGKQGPCCHCGVSSTPLWRNGPPEKPVLCNACGSRWRTKGTLANYTPLHARVDFVDSLKEIKFQQRKFNGVPDHDDDYDDEDEKVSNRSSSVSVVSNPDSFVGQMQSVVWERIVPSKKRTCVGRPKTSSVEKLTKDLYTIMYEQQSSSSSRFSVSSEEELLFENDAPMVSVEIGHGSMLIRHPNSVKEEDSEVSSLSEYYSPDMNNENSLQLEHMKRDKAQQEHEKSYILGNHNSPLVSLDLTDVLNFDVFSQEFSWEEQQELLKLLPSLDTTGFPHSLKGMFTSSQFKENILSFRNLLAEGVFELNLPGVLPEECRKLKGLALSNLSKSKWLERYNLLKDVKCKGGYGDSEVSTGDKFVQNGNSPNGNGKRIRENQVVNCSGLRISSKSPKRMKMMTKSNNDPKDTLNEDTISLFTLPHDNNSLRFDSCHYFTDERTDQEDLLLDMPSNNSFPEAELLLPSTSSSFGAQTSTCNSLIY